MNTKNTLLLTLLPLSIASFASDLCEKKPDDLLCLAETSKIFNFDAPNLIGSLLDKESNDVKAQQPDGILESREYSIFSNQSDHLKELVEQKKFFSASALIQKYEDSYFYKEPLLGGEIPIMKLLSEVEIIVQGIKNSFAPKIDKLINLINKNVDMINKTNKTLSDKWPYFEELITKSELIDEKYNSYRVIQLHKGMPSDTFEKLAALNNKRISLETALKSRALQELKWHDMLSEKSFFDVYPVFLDQDAIVRSSTNVFTSAIEKLNVDQTIGLINKYNLDNTQENKNWLAGILIEKHFVQNSHNPSPNFLDVYKTIKKLKESGLQIDEKDVPKRYKSYLYQIDTTEDLNNNIEHILYREENYLIISDMRNTRVLTKGIVTNKQNSEYLSKIKKTSNPEYASIRKIYNSALKDYNTRVANHEKALAEQKRQKLQYQLDQQARIANAGYSTNCSGRINNNNYYSGNCTTTQNTPVFVPDYSDSLGGIAPAIALHYVNESKEELDRASKRLQETPEEFKEKLYAEYDLYTEVYSLSKTYNANFYFIDKSSQSYQKIGLSKSFDKTFTLAKNLHEKDVNFDSEKFQTQGDIERFSRLLNDMPLHSVMPKVLSIRGEKKNYHSLFDLLDQIRSENKNTNDANTNGNNRVNYIHNRKPTVPSYINDLERIKELLDNGAINQEEYQTLKQKVINKI